MNRMWVQSTIDFVHSLTAIGDFVEIEICFCAPALEQDLERITRLLPIKLPAVLADFFASTSASFTFHYNLGNNISGGGKICLDQLPEDYGKMFGCGDAIGDFNPEIGTRWKSSFPLLALRNGDFIAFDLETDKANPSIVYLSHDEEFVRTLAATFEDFLEKWSKINYLGPEIWELEEWGFLDQETGQLATESPNTDEFFWQFNPQAYSDE